jgi:hypothetical protein
MQQAFDNAGSGPRALLCEEYPATVETRGQPHSPRFPGPGKCLIISCKALEDNEKTAIGHVVITEKPQWERNRHGSGQWSRRENTPAPPSHE